LSDSSSPHRSLSSNPTVAFQRISLRQSFGGEKLLAPTAVHSDSDGSILIADRDAPRVYKISREGKLLSTCGGSGQSQGRFRRPVGVASDDQGRVYVADSDNHRIQVFDSRLRFLRIIDPDLP
jgi:DNA-binding beta-propeller fold protein YncE